MIGGFRKKSKRGNIRQKLTTTGGSDEEEEGENTTESPTLTHVATAPVLSTLTKPKIKKNSSVLSFNDELQTEDEFVLKRSKASLSMRDNVKKDKKRKKTKETFNTDPVNVQEHRNIPLVSKGPVIKTFEDEEEEEEDDDDTSIRFSAGNRFGAPGDIPDAATIFAMKKKREKARQFSGQPNYIPLGPTKKHEGRFPSDKSRLVREEMDDSSDDERIEMKGSSTVSHPALERRKQVAKALEEAHDESDHDEKGHDNEEFQRWEDELIKKGSKIPMQQLDPYGPRLPDTNGSTTMVTSHNVYCSALPPPPPFPYIPTLPTGYAPQLYNPMYSIPTTDNQIFDVDIVLKRLSEQLDTKKQLIRLHEQQRDKTKFDLESSKENIISLDRKAGDVSDRFSFYQDIRGFVKDLTECLNEKVKKINELEQSMHQVLHRKSEKLVTRRQNDVKDEVDEIGGKGHNESDRIKNVKNRRIAEREGRRSRRKDIRRTAATAHYDGMSSDDEMQTSDSLRIDAEKSKIMKEAENIFDDVVNDFTSIHEIMSRFEQWKYGFNDSYKEAYLGLCLPKLFNPFIKLELLSWNPLELDCDRDFEEMEWYLSLALYGDHSGEVDEGDEDLKLLPNIIEKVLIPKITVLIKDVWDPLSSNQTKLATFLFQRLVDDFPTITKDSKQTKGSSQK